MISHFPEDSLAYALTIIEWRPEIRRDKTQNILERHLKIMHLINRFSLIERTQILMAPTMRSYLYKNIRER